METIMKLLIALGCLLIVFLATMSIFLIKYQPLLRYSSGGVHDSTASSSRSRMAARWAHMDQASRRRGGEVHTDEEYDQTDPSFQPNSTDYDGKPDDFGSLGRLDQAHRTKSQGSLAASLVGTGPNGTRTLLMGWFGLDEPTSAGYNTQPETKEKTMDGDALPMRATNDHHLEEPYQHDLVVPHRRVPTTDEHDWEIRSEISDV